MKVKFLSTDNNYEYNTDFSSVEGKVIEANTYCGGYVVTLPEIEKLGIKTEDLIANNDVGNDKDDLYFFDFELEEV